MRLEKEFLGNFIFQNIYVYSWYIKGKFVKIALAFMKIFIETVKNLEFF